MEAYDRRISRRSLLAGAGATAVYSGLASSSAAKSLAGSGTLNVYDGGGGWGAAQKAAFFDPFEKESGIKVVRVPVYPLGRIRAGIEAGAPPYDVFHLAGTTLPSFVKSGLLQKIDYSFCEQSDLEGFTLIKPGEHLLPALVGSVIVAFDDRAFPKEKPSNWVDFWDVKRFPGLRSLNVGSTGPTAATFEIALLADGVAKDKLYPIDWDRAFRSLERLKPHVPKFWSGYGEGVQMLIDKTVAIASTWNGRVSDAQAQGAPLGMSWDQGILQGNGGWVVPRNAQNAENAFKFIAFAARADRQAEFSNLITYAPTNSKAYSMIKPERMPLLPTSSGLLEKQILQSAAWWSTEDAPGVTNEAMALKHWEKWITKS
jgi:putative spermidine/putrescine transport system substrate-binding protein